MIRRFPALAATTAVAALTLSACVTVFPEADPVQLYRFGQAPAGEAVAPAPQRIGVRLGPVAFPQAAAGDRILTSEGGQVSYVAAARWAAPAEVLFAEGLDAAFDRRASRVRLISRRDTAAAALNMDLAVRSFEARYDGRGAPVVVMELDARLTRPDRAVVSERRFSVSRPASENRVTAIVAAYDAAADQLFGEVIAWAETAAR